VNLHHLRAFFWLQWRLRVNQLQRGGLANKIILAILAVGIVLAAIGLFAGFFALAFVFEKTPPTVLLFTWDGLVLVFLAWWGGGLMFDLQRSEGLSLTKFLHLPVSLSGVFVLNYFTSLFSINLFLFVPTMVGFSLGLSFAIGPIMLLLLPLVAAFLLMVSALSYQFQGWLASLMVDKRRRRTVIFLVTLAFILIFQLPNLINIYRPWEGKQDEIKEQIAKERAELDRALNAKEITVAEHQKRNAEAQRERAKRSVEGYQQTWKQAEQVGWLANLVLPPGWLPLGAMGLAEGNVFPALLGMLAMSLIGTASLWRAYRTTVRLYTGQFTAGTTPAIVARPVEAIKEKAVRPPDGLIARKILWLSEPASAIALGCFRSLTRAPEAKMLLLSPVFLVVIFGGMFWRGNLDVPEMARPLMAYGAMATIFLTLIQLVGNQFGLDRSGFRIFVLSPVARRDILLGKNLAVLPVAMVLVSPLLILIQVMYPMRVDHLVALVPQFVSMYLLFCLVANFLSILAPMAIAAGSLKPASTRFLPILVQLFFMSMFPLVLAPTFLPLGIEFGLDALEWGQGLPICLVLTVLECAAIIGFYRVVMTWQGNLLQAREQSILETVTTKAE
jgi:ABC-2 type transport system permease protein